MNRGAIAEITLSALRNNLQIIKRIVGNRHIIAVVKADAYGHGSVGISKRLLEEGVSCLAVAYTGEARILRDSGIKADIIILFDCTCIEDYFDYKLTPVIYDINTALEFSREAEKRRMKITVHLKIDTGMGRIGFNPGNAVSDAVRISEMEGIELKGLMSHFSEADLPDGKFSVRQLELFKMIKKDVQEKLGYSLMSHMANSGAVLSFDDSLLDAVRPGIMLYGYSPCMDDSGLKPLMRIKTRILSIKNLPAGSTVSYGRTFVTKRASRIAVIPVGYADGYSRRFSNNAEVIVRGKRVPVAGRICMDLTMIDVTGVEGVSQGDEVVLLGGQGVEVITARELASRIDTIPYDILTSLGGMAKKEYIH